MFLIGFPVKHETWFFIIAGFLSIIFGIRGIFIQIHNVEIENKDLKDKENPEWGLWQRIFVHYFQDFVYNFVGSLAGWEALYIFSYRIFESESTQLHLDALRWSDFGLVVFALLGIVGKLPQAIEHSICSIGDAVKNITGKLSKN